MRINEVRNLLSRYSKDQLCFIISEIYKSLPKAIKNGCDIDGLLANPDAFLQKGKGIRKQTSIPDIEELSYEIEEFIENAYKQYYFAPNNVIPKQKRSQWRFMVKRFHRDLLAAAVLPENLQIVSELLEKLYKLLCYSCSYVLFSSNDSFNSIGIDQADFFGTVLALKSQNRQEKDFITEAMLLIVGNFMNGDMFNAKSMDIFFEFISDHDSLLLAEEISVDLLRELKRTPRKKSSGSMDDSNHKDKLNHLVEITFLSCAYLHDFDRGIMYYLKNYDCYHEEVKLYKLITLLQKFDQGDFIVREYQRAIGNGVQPRNQLIELVNQYTTTGRLTKC